MGIWRQETLVNQNFTARKRWKPIWRQETQPTIEIWRQETVDNRNLRAKNIEVGIWRQETLKIEILQQENVEIRIGRQETQPTIETWRQKIVDNWKMTAKNHWSRNFTARSNCSSKFWISTVNLIPSQKLSAHLFFEDRLTPLGKKIDNI